MLSVGWKPVLATAFFFFLTVWFYKASHLKSKSELLVSSTFYAIWLAWLTFQSSESNLTDRSLLPSFHSCIVLGPQTQKPHQSRRKAASFPFAPPFKKCQFCTVPLSGMSQKTFVRPYITSLSFRDSYIISMYITTRKRIRSSVQPEHSSNLATTLSRAMRVGSSVRDVLDSEIPLPSKCKELLSTRKGYTFAFLKTTATKTRK